MSGERLVLFGEEVEVRSVRDKAEVREAVVRRYRELGDAVRFDDDGMTVTSGGKEQLSPGCLCCKGGTWLSLWMGLRCNAACAFCSRAKINDHGDEPAGFQLGMPFDDLVATILREPVAGVSYSGGEPLLYLEEKVLPLASRIAAAAPGVYQWVYTNGKLLAERTLGRLAAAGIREVRVNLAATGFDPAVVSLLGAVARIVGRATVEVPAIPEVGAKLIGERFLERVAEEGAGQINLAELYVMRREACRYLAGRDVYHAFAPGRIPLSPTDSRHVAVDVMEHAVRGGIPILVNDCSNDAKSLQMAKRAHLERLFRIYS